MGGQQPQGTNQPNAFQRMQQKVAAHHAAKIAKNEQMLAKMAEDRKNGITSNDMAEAYGHGLRGNKGNALYLLYKARHELKEEFNIDIKNPTTKIEKATVGIDDLKTLENPQE